VVDSLPDGAIAGVNISVSVAASRLGALDASPESVSLLRRHNGTWRSLPTTVLNETNGTFRFHARSPGFSRFAVVANGPADGGSAGDTPGIDDGVGSNLAVTDASLVQTNVSAGTELGVNVTVANRGNASGSYTAGLALNGSVVATADSPAVAANESATFRVSYAADPGTYAVSVNGTAAGTVTVVPGASDGSSAGDAPPVTVTNVTVGQSTLAPGETLTVNVTVRNDDDRPRVYTAGLALNGGVVATASSPPIPAGESRTFSLLHTVNRTGQFSVAVNRTTGGTITVEESGGLLASVLGLVGFLPMGLVRPLAMFVLLPLAVIYGVLKALAIYLGY
jgi:hypothetical protein